MPFEEEERLLSTAYILEPLSKEELEELARRNPDTRLEPGEIFFTLWERSEKLFVLKEDRIQILRGASQDVGVLNRVASINERTRMV
jgi:hypothetical protein